MKILDLGQTIADLASDPSSLLAIEASAGTGKTWTLERLVLGLVLKRPLALREILVLTYTEAATEELKERIRSRLAELCMDSKDGRELRDLLGLPSPLDEENAERVRQALADFDQASISTIHGFCLGVLADYPLELGMVQPQIDLDAARDEQLRIVRAALLKTLYGPGVHDLDKAGALAMLSLQGYQDDEPMANLVRMVDKWLKAGYDDELCFKSARPAWRRLREHLVAGEGQEEVLSASGELAAAGEALLDWMETRSAAEGRDWYKARGFNMRSQPKILREARELASWCSRLTADRDAFFRNLSSLPKPEIMDGMVSTWTGKEAGKLKVATLRDSMAGQEDLLDRWVGALETWTGAVLDYERACTDILGYPPRGGLGDAGAWSFDHWAAAILFHHLVEVVRPRFRELQLQEGLVDFSGMIDLVHRGLTMPESPLPGKLRGRWKAILVDEFQDTDQRQWEIFRSLFAGSTMVVVGDPKQAIYAFRGADVGVYRRAVAGLETERPGTRRRLDTNYRSSGVIVEGVNHLFGLLPATAGFDYSPVRASPRTQENLEGKFGPLDEPGFHGVALPAKKAMGPWVHWICREIGQLVEAGWSPSDMTVLVEQNNDGVWMQQVLMKSGIPARLKGRGSLARSLQTDTILHACNAMAQPRSQGAIRAFALSLLGGASVDTLAEDLGLAAQRIHQAVDTFGTHGFLAAMEGLIAPRRPALAARIDGTRVLTDLWHLVELLDAHVQGLRLDHQRLGHACADFLQGLRTDNEQSLHLDRQDPAVGIMTMHSSKGLEFPVVFVLPHLKDKDRARKPPLHMNREGVREVSFDVHRTHLEGISTAEREARLTLMYVVLTRASCRCYLPLRGIETKAEPAKVLSATMGLLLGAEVPPVTADPDEGAFRKLFLVRSGDHGKEVGQGRPGDPGRHVPGGKALNSTGSGEMSPGARPGRLLLAPLGPATAGAGLEADPPQHRFPRRTSFSALGDMVLRQGGAAVHGVGAPDEATGSAPGAGVTVQSAESKLPKGRDFGHVVHHIMETARYPELRVQCRNYLDDPASPGSRDFQDHLAKVARSFGYGAGQARGWVGELAAMLARTLDLELDLGNPSEGGAATGEDRGGVPGSATGQGRRCTIGSLEPGWLRREQAFTFGRSGRPLVLEDPELLDALGLAVPLEIDATYLTGVIDVLVRTGSGIDVIDWKTNALDDWGPGALAEAMDGHLYRLQAMLYLAAVRKAFPGLPVGKAHYVFMRGPAVQVFAPEGRLVDRFLSALEVNNDQSLDR